MLLEATLQFVGFAAEKGREGERKCATGVSVFSLTAVQVDRVRAVVSDCVAECMGLGQIWSEPVPG